MICFLGNCQAQRLAKSELFGSVTRKWLLFRNPILHEGPGFGQAQRILLETLRAEDIAVLKETGLLTAHPSLEDVRSLAPKAVAVTMFHEAPMAVDRESGAAFNFMDCAHFRDSFPDVREFILRRCRLESDVPSTYPNRFTAFIRDLRRRLGCPVTVVLRLRHFPIMAPDPACCLSDWDEIAGRCHELMIRLAGEDAGVRLVDMDRVAAGIWNETRDMDHVSDTFVMGRTTFSPAPGFALQRDMEHMSHRVHEALAEKTLAALTGGEVVYTSLERVPPDWSLPAPPPEPMPLAVLESMLDRDEPVMRLQQRALLELLRRGPSESASLLERHLEKLKPHLHTVEYLACNLAILPDWVSRGLLERALRPFGARDTDTSARLYRNALEGRLLQLMMGLGRAGDMAGAERLAALARMVWLRRPTCDLALGRLMLDEGHAHRAMEHILAALGKADDEGVEWMVEAARLRARAGDPAGALDMLAPMVEAREEHAVHETVVMLRTQGRPEEALTLLEDWRESLRQPPPSWLMRERVTTAYSMGLRAEAFAMLEEGGSAPVEDGPEMPDTKEFIPLPPGPGHALVLRAGPLVAADFAVTMLQGAGWEVDVLANSGSGGHFASMPGIGEVHTFSDGRYYHGPEAVELFPGVFRREYGLAVLVMAVWDADDYKEFLALMGEIPARQRSCFVFSQLFNTALRNALLSLPAALGVSGNESAVEEPA